MKGWLIVIVLTAMAASVVGCSGAHHASRAGGGRAAAVQRVSWPEARQLIRTCKVKAVEETHRRTVTLTLRNGRKAFTHEPPTANVVHEVVRVNGQRKCPSITLAME